jgi:hypothetical protein
MELGVTSAAKSPPDQHLSKKRRQSIRREEGKQPSIRCEEEDDSGNTNIQAGPTKAK